MCGVCPFRLPGHFSYLVPLPGVLLPKFLPHGITPRTDNNKTCWARMEARGRSIFSLVFHLSCEGNLVLPLSALHSQGQACPDFPRPPGHNVELISPPGWSWEVPDHLPAEGHLAQLVLPTQTGTHQPQNSRSPSLRSHPPLTTAVILTPSSGKKLPLGASLLGLLGARPPLGMGPGPGKGLCKSVGRLCGVAAAISADC